MLSQGDSKCKYIAIVREPQIDKGLPIYMKTKFAFYWAKTTDISEKEFKKLLYSIFDCELSPPLGDIPDFITRRLQMKNIRAKSKSL